MERKRKGCLIAIREICIFAGGAVEGAAFGALLTGIISALLINDFKAGLEAGAVSGVFIGGVINLIRYNRSNTPVGIINSNFYKS